MFACTCYGVMCVCMCVIVQFNLPSGLNLTGGEVNLSAVVEGGVLRRPPNT